MLSGTRPQLRFKSSICYVTKGRDVYLTVTYGKKCVLPRESLYAVLLKRELRNPRGDLTAIRQSAEGILETLGKDKAE